MFFMMNPMKWISRGTARRAISAGPSSLRKLKEAAVLTPQQHERVKAARERFGKPFSWEPGSDWKPNAEPYLTRWLRSKQKDDGHQ